MNYETIVEVAISMGNVDILRKLWYEVENLSFAEREYFKNKIAAAIPQVGRQHNIDLQKERERYFESLTDTYERRRIKQLFFEDLSGLIAYLRGGGPQATERTGQFILDEVNKIKYRIDKESDFGWRLGQITYWIAAEYPSQELLSRFLALGVNFEAFQAGLFAEANREKHYEPIVYMIIALNKIEKKDLISLEKRLAKNLKTIFGSEAIFNFAQIFLELVVKNRATGDEVVKTVFDLDIDTALSVAVELGSSRGVPDELQQKIAHEILNKLQKTSYIRSKVISTVEEYTDKKFGVQLFNVALGRYDPDIQFAEAVNDTLFNLGDSKGYKERQKTLRSLGDPSEEAIDSLSFSLSSEENSDVEEYDTEEEISEIQDEAYESRVSFSEVPQSPRSQRSADIRARIQARLANRGNK